tara:strand:- start:868 stop:1401 length:534 start_codon:yes stop_codon:yes gene_type:complete
MEVMNDQEWVDTLFDNARVLEIGKQNVDSLTVEQASMISKLYEQMPGASHTRSRGDQEGIPYRIGSGFNDYELIQKKAQALWSMWTSQETGRGSSGELLGRPDEFNKALDDWYDRAGLTRYNPDSDIKIVEEEEADPQTGTLIVTIRFKERDPRGGWVTFDGRDPEGNYINPKYVSE